MMLGKRPLEPFWFFTWCISGPFITLVSRLREKNSNLNLILLKIRLFSFHQLFVFEHQLKVIMNIQHMPMYLDGLWFVHQSFLFQVL